MREASPIFSTKKYWHIWDIKVWNFNVSLTNEVVSFEQPGPENQYRDKNETLVSEVSKFIRTVNLGVRLFKASLA